MSTTPRSRSRSKRSTTNLSDLRLAPLSAKFADGTSAPPAPKTPSFPLETPLDATFSRQHPSYLQGKSAPTTPGILSRSSSRKYLGGGLSRKNSLYNDDDDDDDDDDGGGGEDDADDNAVKYSYAGRAARDPRKELRRGSVDNTSSLVPKARSEAALLTLPLTKPHSPTRRYKYPIRRSRTGASTPSTTIDESWLSHAGATASALVQEGKGQSWLASREVVARSTAESEEDEEEDDQYEEMAKLSASTAQLHFAPFEGGSPVSARVSRWGSRYGSRSASRRTSRRASPSAGMRTPRPGDGVGYFDGTPGEDTGRLAGEREEEGESEIEIEELAEGTFGLGPLVDRLMGFNPFKGDDGVESTDDEVGREEDGKEEVLRKRSVELKRRRDEKAKLVAQPPPALMGEGGSGEGEVGGWSDAAWLLSVATKAMF